MHPSKKKPAFFDKKKANGGNKFKKPSPVAPHRQQHGNKFKKPSPVAPQQQKQNYKKSATHFGLESGPTAKKMKFGTPSTNGANKEFPRKNNQPVVKPNKQMQHQQARQQMVKKGTTFGKRNVQEVETSSEDEEEFTDEEMEDEFESEEDENEEDLKEGKKAVVKAPPKEIIGKDLKEGKKSVGQEKSKVELKTSPKEIIGKAAEIKQQSPAATRKETLKFDSESEEDEELTDEELEDELDSEELEDEFESDEEEKSDNEQVKIQIPSMTNKKGKEQTQKEDGKLIETKKMAAKIPTDQEGAKEVILPTNPKYKAIVAEEGRRRAERDKRCLFLRCDALHNMTEYEKKALHPDCLAVRSAIKVCWLVFASEASAEKAYEILSKKKEIGGKEFFVDLCGSKAKKQPVKEKNVPDRAINPLQLAVTNFPNSTTEDQLKVIFPTAKTVKIAKHDPGKNKKFKRPSYAVINFDSDDSCKKAFDKSSNTKIGGVHVDVFYKRE